MNKKKEDNSAKRKNASLTFEEWSDFFIIPINNSSKLFPAKDSNDFEIDRFKKHGFDRKIKQSFYARVLGFIFWIIIIFGLINFIENHL
ncbi:hypothetical protein MTsPCn9_05820 [Croceitalea sp. MTPC9]|uniref:hypothetical protein n=1 Tax=unclassified Croceitalea TaxID=2632280 RepID=UPI002B3D9251|nr:hypothetical protein MTsPCn6_02890 [Croceitalea sp. MTPC6]GMN15646.1 hypothetical protein MTsPCn9_05820 [Croceitalea sp. MTPC9]